jgi:HSP20 family protein
MATTPVDVKRSAPVPTASPDAFQSLRSEMDRLFDRFTMGFGIPPLCRMFDTPPGLHAESSFNLPTPSVDIAEEAGDYKLTAELPGMSEKDIELVVSGDTLTLKGEKKAETERKEKNYTLSERTYGSFRRSFYLPQGIDREKIDATFSKGVLTVTLPKTAAAAAEQKKIKVKEAA